MIKSFFEADRNIMLSGGKLLDDGMYGCIFTPPLNCKNKKTQQDVQGRKDLTISKLIPTDYAKKEDAVSILIRKIPLWKNYFIVSETMCEPALTQQDKDVKECHVIEKKSLSKFRLLFMPYGGQSLHVHRFTITNFNFMNFCTHLISAGAILNLFGVVHRDIHSGNILVDEEHVPRIIDFNLAIFVENKPEVIKLSHQYNYMLSQEPPDSTLVNAIKLGYQAKSVISSLIYKKPITQKIRNLLQFSEEDMKKELDDFYNRSKSVEQGNDVDWFHVYWRTIDSWAIGVIIVELFYKLSLWPEFSSSLERVKPKLFPLLRGLCSMSPLHRMDCVQALHSLDPNHFIIRKYGTSWLSKVGYGSAKH
jgi:serine/threonine protein kinase